MAKIRELTKNEVTITITSEYEYTHQVDSLSDCMTKEQIGYNRENVSPWYWCTVKVTVSWNGVSEHKYLGACSYESEQYFIENSCYYEDMVEEALSDLNKTLQAQYKNLSLLEVNQ